MAEAGHQVVAIAASAEEVLASGTPGTFDVVILDIRLNGALDGIELAHRLRAATPALRHLYISGSSDPATRARAMATEPTAFLQKPIRPADLFMALRALGG